MYLDFCLPQTDVSGNGGKQKNVVSLKLGYRKQSPVGWLKHQPQYDSCTSGTGMFADCENCLSSPQTHSPFPRITAQWQLGHWLQSTSPDTPDWINSEWCEPDFLYIHWNAARQNELWSHSSPLVVEFHGSASELL